MTAVALAIASPAVAQTAPAQQPQGHAQHQPGQGHDQHGQMPAHGAQGDCCADRNGNGRMDCCERMEAGDRRGCCAQPAAPAVPAAQPQGHNGH